MISDLTKNLTLIILCVLPLKLLCRVELVLPKFYGLTLRFNQGYTTHMNALYAVSDHMIMVLQCFLLNIHSVNEHKALQIPEVLGKLFKSFKQGPISNI